MWKHTPFTEEELAQQGAKPPVSAPKEPKPARKTTKPKEQ